ASGRVALENGVPLPLLPDPTTNLQWDEIKPLSGKPYSHNVLSPSNLNPRYQMRPSINLRLELPSNSVPTILIHKGKSWDMVYNGQSKLQTFSSTGWKKFAIDSCLKVGDACIFELMESSDKKVIFEVQILRGDIPFKFLENETTIGQSPEMP
ncbi:B3 domain-containing protein, partial [Mucuna pruriens]